MPKTTIELSEDLVRKAKALAAKRGTTLRALIEQGLRAELRAQVRSPRFSLRDASVRGRGLQKEFRDKEWPTIRDAIYEDRGG